MVVKQKILVTGANGQLGTSLRDIAANFSAYDFIFVTKEELPVEKEAALSGLMQEHHPAWLVNCAAYTAVDLAETETGKAMQINGEAVGSMAQLCQKFGCRFIHISTDYVFDGNGSSPYKEDHPVSPVNAYGLSKLKGEEAALKNNSDSIIIRSSWIYSEHGKNFVRTMIRLMKERTSINVVNDQFGSPTYARDLSEVIMAVIRANIPGGLYHFCNKGIISWYEFARTIGEMCNSACTVNPIPTAAYPTPAKRPHYSALDTTKLESLGITVRNWKEGLSDCLQRMKD